MLGILWECESLALFELLCPIVVFHTHTLSLFLSLVCSLLSWWHPLVRQHIDSFNYFVNTEISKIVAANNIVTVPAEPGFFLEYEKILIGRLSLCRSPLCSLLLFFSLLSF
jgi:hypothetical protein